MKLKINLTITLFAISILIPSFSLAQTYTALEPLPCIPGGGIQASDCPGGAAGNLQATFSFQNYVQYIFNLIIALAAAAAVFMIVYGGLQYMTTDSWQNKSEGLDKARNAVYGLLLVLASFLILRTIDPRLVAIPSTLVPPLNVNLSDYAGLDDFFRDLERDAAIYHADMTAFQNARQTAQTALTKAEQDKLAIDDQIRFLNGDTDRSETSEAGITELCRHTSNPQINALCVQRAQIDGSIEAAKDTIVLNTATAAMRATIQHCGQTTSDPACFANLGEQAKLTVIFNKYSSQLDTDQRNQLWAYKKYGDSWFTINRVISKRLNGSGVPVTEWRTDAVAGLATLKIAVAAFARSPGSDPAVLADMRTIEAALTKQVEDITKVYDAPRDSGGGGV